MNLNVLPENFLTAPKATGNTYNEVACTGVPVRAFQRCPQLFTQRRAEMSKITFLPLFGEYVLVVLVTSNFDAGSSFVHARINETLADHHPVRCGSGSEATDASTSGENPTDQIDLSTTLSSGASLQSQGLRPDESLGSGRMEGYRFSSTPTVSTAPIPAEQASIYTGNVLAQTIDSSSSRSSKTAKENLSSSRVKHVPVQGVLVPTTVAHHPSNRTFDLAASTVASSVPTGTSTSPSFGNKSVGSLQSLLMILRQEGSKLPASKDTSIDHETSRRRLSQTVSLLQTIQTSWELERPCNTTAKGTDVHVLVRNSRRFLGKWCDILEGAEILYELLRDDCCNTTDSRSTEKEDLCSRWPRVFPKYFTNGNGTRTYCPSRASVSELFEDANMTIAGKSWIEQIRSRFTNLSESLNFSPNVNNSLCKPKICLFEFRREITITISSAVVELVESLSDTLDIGSLIVDLMAKNQNATQPRPVIDNESTRDQVSSQAKLLNVSLSLNIAFNALTNKATSPSDCDHTQWCEGARMVLPLLENKTFLKQSRIRRMKHSVSILCRASSFLSTANMTKNMVQSRRLRSDTSSLACPSMPPLCTDLLTTDCSDKRLFQTSRSQFSVSPNALLYRYLLKVLRSSVIDQNTSNFTFPTHCRLSCTVGEEYKSISQWVLAIFLYITDAVFCFAMILSFYLLIVSKKNRYRMTRNPRRPYLYLWGMALVTFTVRATGR